MVLKFFAPDDGGPLRHYEKHYLKSKNLLIRKRHHNKCFYYNLVRLCYSHKISTLLPEKNFPFKNNGLNISYLKTNAITL